ncbi:hypothetical protein QBC44DRAFT_236421 [Cladorrhinum sp. PSN332]|nr:hypothetical protein QBC44DRAFT_236421 [Cladorrhinum sp. PSN332]
MPQEQQRGQRSQILNHGWSIPPLASQAPRKLHLPPRATECHQPGDQAQVPFVAAAQHNDQNSPIYRLPRPLLVQLMRHLDPVSLECLRRTGRRFLQIFDRCKEWPTYRMYPWSAPNLVVSMSAFQRQRLLELLAKDAYCTKCQESLRAPDRTERVAKAVRYLHCSGCQRDHPACLFAPEQRSKTRESRLCVGRTGHVRLCAHSTVTWSQVVTAAQKNPSKTQVITKCKIKTHSRPCQWRRGGVFGRIFRSNNHGSLLEYPLLLYKLRTTGPTISLHWTAHMNLGSRDETACTSAALHDRFALLRGQQGHFICPEVAPGQIVESRIFDPHSCDCVKYYGLMHLTTDWSRSPNNDKKNSTRRAERIYGCLDQLNEISRLGPVIRAQEQSSTHRPQGIGRSSRQMNKKQRPVSQTEGDACRHIAMIRTPPVRGASRMSHAMGTIVRPWYVCCPFFAIFSLLGCL